jgi:hypothetical protein
MDIPIEVYSLDFDR